MRNSRGFTLVEIAIVLVVIGLMVGGVFKGQELIRGAQVRRLISDHDGFRTAINAFTDRYGSEPGDYHDASQHISCAPACLNGNGNRRVESNAIPANGSEVHEELLVWTHLAWSGFIPGTFTMTAGETVPTLQNSPVNFAQRYWEFIFDGNFGTVASGATRHNLKTGNQVPVDMIAQLDIRIDDGLPNTGTFQFSPFAPGDIAPTGGAAAAPACTSAAGPTAVWNVVNGSLNCGAASLF
jgi:prepilin-type N-terminal cleavage/methylation domain-containing protein